MARAIDRRRTNGGDRSQDRAANPEWNEPEPTVRHVRGLTVGSVCLQSDSMPGWQLFNRLI
jgi:hypothetical protein